jgi:4-amino-4-deoxy-L-arabinose transferase-like glycosyltransferase
MIEQQPKERRWWRKRHWWVLLIIAVILSLPFYFAQHRAHAIQQLRAEMRERAVNGPSVEEPPPCVTVANTGEIYCAKPMDLLACQSKVFIDPFEIWAGAESDSDLKQLVWARYDQNRDTEKLAQWFACQGFKVSYQNGMINAGVLTPNGYGIFNKGTFPWPPAWAESFSTGGKLDGKGRLRMDIGTTYF